MKIGDRVSVIDDDMTGVITSVHGNTIVLKDEFGFTHQYSKNKVVIQEIELYENLDIEIKPEITKPISKKHSKKQMVLDLHFEQLVKNPLDYDAFERLFLQKEKLIETLDFCRKNKIKKLEIIHGIGDGTLQNMVYDTLTSQTEIDFHNQEILHQQSGSVIVYF